MARTKTRQDTQIRSSDSYDDSLVPGASLETAATNLENDLNAIRSQVSRILGQLLPWTSDIPSLLNIDGETKQRDLETLNIDLSGLEVLRILQQRDEGYKVTVLSGANYQILSAAEAPSEAIATGATSLGAVCAVSPGSFDQHALDIVAGDQGRPKNLVELRNAAGESIYSSDRVVYGLLQVEGTATDGATFDDTVGGNRAKLSFVRTTATQDGLEVVPTPDIENSVVQYRYFRRVRLEDLIEGVTGVPFATAAPSGGGAALDRQDAYDAQGTLPVDLTTDAFLTLTSAIWSIESSSRVLMRASDDQGPGGLGTFYIGAPYLNSDAEFNQFNTGVEVDLGATRISIAADTSGWVESAGVLGIRGNSDVRFDDQYRADGSSLWVDTAGIQLAGAVSDWNDYRGEYGEIPILRAIFDARKSVPKSATLTRDGNKAVASVTVVGEATWTISRGSQGEVASLTNGFYLVTVNRDVDDLVTGITVT